MTSPLTAIRNYYFIVKLGAENKKLPDIDCFFGDDIAIHFLFEDENGDDISVVAATATFKAAAKGFTAATFEDDQTGAVLLTGNAAVVSINTETDLLNAGSFSYQLRLTIAGKTSVAVYGDIISSTLID